MKYPAVMGILNMTPDSFSDGGSYKDTDAALKRAFEMVDDGASIIDVGGESTRPGWIPVSAEEEISRIVDVIREFTSSSDVPVSVDTMKPEVAAAAADAGATVINDVYGLRNEGMIEVVSETDSYAIIMHMHGGPNELHSVEMSGDAKPQIREFLNGRAEAAIAGGVKKERIILDPGVGFGKTHELNSELTRSASYFGKEYPVLIGPSRKRYLEFEYGRRDDDASAEAAAEAVKHGAAIVRVHNVKKTCERLSASSRE